MTRVAGGGPVTVVYDRHRTHAVTRTDRAAVVYPDVSTLTDDFATQDTAKWTGWGTNVVWNARGTVDIAVTPNYFNVTATSQYRLTGSSVYAKPFSFPPIVADNSSEMILRCEASATAAVLMQWVESGGVPQFLMNEITAGVTSSTQVAYDAATMAYIRIRELGGTLFWETSPDAVTWTIRRQSASSNDWSSVTVILMAGYWGTVTGAGTASWDAVNTPQAAAPAFTGTAALAGTGTLGAAGVPTGTGTGTLTGSGSLGVTGTPVYPAVSTLTDAFTTQDTTKWTGWNPGVIDLVGGAVQIACANNYPTLISAGSYSLRGSSVFAQMVTPPNNVTDYSEQAMLRAENDANNYWGVMWGGSATAPTLVAREVVAGVSDETSVTYNAATMKFWRVRHDGTNIVWEYSADAATWTTHRTKVPAAALNLDAVRVGVQAGFWGTVTGAGAATFDNVNTTPSAAFTGTVLLAGAGQLATAAVVGVAGSGALAAAGQLAVVAVPAVARAVPFAATGTLVAAGTPRPVSTAAFAGTGSLSVVAAAGTPKASTLADAFATADAAKWTGIDGTNVVVTGGQLRVNTTGNYYSASSARTYDLTGSSVVVEVPQVPNVGTGSTSAYLTAYVSASGNSASIFWEGGTLHASYNVGGVVNAVEILYSPTAHRFWRIRETAGTLYWEASGTGASWSTLRVPVTTPLTLTAVTITLQSGFYGTESAPGFALFDNVNLPPTPAVPGAARTFYVDPAGSDAADGLTTGTAWATLAKVNATPLFPGDQVLLKRASSWTGALSISDSGASGNPITVGTFGAGAYIPIIEGGGSSGVAGTTRPGEVYGSWVLLDSIQFRGSVDTDLLVYGSDVTVQGCAAQWGSFGMRQLPQAARVKFTYSTITDINVGIIGPGTNDDAGGSAVLLEGNAAEVAFNTMSGCYWTSPDYGVDGCAVEVYGATGALVHHNRVSDCVTFTELGNPATNGNTFYDNVITSTLAASSGFTVHGALYDDGVTPDPFGPVTGTRAYHNTIALTGGDSATVGVWVSPNGEVDFRNNIITVTGSAKAITIGATNRTVTEAGNVYWSSAGAAGTVVTLPAAMAASSVKADPLFIGGGDYRLRPGSPAIDRGVTITGTTITTDYGGLSRTQGTAPDSGAYEGAAVTVQLTGSGSLAMVVVPRAVGAVALAGAGSLTAARTVTANRGVNVAGAEFGITPTGGDGSFPGTYGNWHYDAPASVAYLAGRGVKYVRLPVAWERLQPVRLGAFDSAEQGRITTYLNACQTNGVRVVLEPHDYARYREGNPTTVTRVLGTDLAVSDLTDFWTRFVGAFGSHAAVHGWELMNEPHDLPSSDTGTTLAATWDATLSGWVGNNATLARTTTVVRTGAGALQVTANANGNAEVRTSFYVGAIATKTFTAWVRSNGAARSAQFVVNWFDTGGGYLSTSTTGFVAATSTTWQQSTGTVTPPAGAVSGEVYLQATSAVSGEVFYWDDFTTAGGMTAQQTGALLWETTCQTLVTAIRNAGDTHTVYVPGYSYQTPINWQTNHGAPFVTDPQNKVKYAAHLYFDSNNVGTYPATYAAETTAATGAGYASVTARALAWLQPFTNWCAAYGVAGAITETAWVNGADATSWNATGDAVYSAYDTAGLDVWYWATGEAWGTTYPLNPYDTAGGANLSRALAQSGVIEAHWGTQPAGGAVTFGATGALAGVGVPRPSGAGAFAGTGALQFGVPAVATGGAVTLAATGTLAPAATGVAATAQVVLSATGALAPVGVPAVTRAVTLAGVGALALAVTPATAGAVVLSATGGLTIAAAGSGAGIVALAGTGTLTVPGVVVGAAGTAAFTGAGSLAVTASAVTVARAVTFGADGALSFGTRTPAVTGPAALAGTGALAFGAVVAAPGAVVLAGTGSLAVAGRVAAPGVVVLAGTGALGAVSTSGQSAVTFAVTGSLAVAAPNLAVAGVVTLAGTGSLQLIAVVAVPVAVVLTVTGSLAIAGVPVPAQIIPLTVTGSLATVAVVAVSGPSVLAVVGALVVAGGLAVPTPFTVTGTLAVTARPGVNVGVTLAGAGALAMAAAHPGPIGTAQLAGVGTLAVAMIAMATGGGVTLVGAGFLGVVAGLAAVRGTAGFGAGGLLEIVAVARGAIVHRPYAGDTSRRGPGTTRPRSSGTTPHI